MTGLIALLAFACSGGGMEQQASGDSVASVPWTEDSGDDDTGTDSAGSDDSDAGGVGDSGDSGTDTAGSGSGSGSDSGTPPPDDDADGWSADVDCDDHDATIHPSASETCNGIDDDCNAAIDDGLAVYTSYADGDGDGFGAGAGHVDCLVSFGFVTNADDCDDTNATRNPSASETCNGMDDDCDAAVDEGVTVRSYADADGDGFGAGPSREDCAVPSGFVTNAEDCDDSDASVSPLGAETCNGIDDDCDASIDDGLPSYTSYADGDGDGYGSGPAYTDCRVPSGFATTSGDCDDGHSSVHPGGFEICNDGLDSDCDGSPGADCTLSGERDLVDGDWNVTGNDASNAFGTWADIGGDLDGDGSEDILAIAPWAKTTIGSATYVEGAAYVFFGATGGAAANASDASVTYLGGGTDALVSGRALATDVDSDGYDDFLVGSPGYDSYDGVVHLVFGPFAVGDTFIATSSTLEALDSSEPAAEVGSNVSDAGDVDGDGTPDLLLGAAGADHGTDTDPGATYLLLGPVTGSVDLPTAAHATLYGDHTFAGDSSHAVGGDLDSDGYSDVIIGMPFDSSGSVVFPGGVGIFRGPFSGEMTMASADTQIEGKALAGRLGWDVAIVEDQDGDGYRELMASETRADNGSLTDAGAVYLWSGDLTPGSTIDSSDAVATWKGVEDDQNAGTSIATGDVDGDGTPDVIIGAGGDTTRSSTEGTVYVDYGPMGGTSDVDSLDAIFHGQGSDDGAGWSLGAGDANGDGYDDFFVGAPGFEDGSRSNAGRGYLWYGLGF